MAINWLDVHTDVADKPSGESMANYLSAIPSDAGAVLTQAENVADFGPVTAIPAVIHHIGGDVEGGLQYVKSELAGGLSDVEGLFHSSPRRSAQHKAAQHTAEQVGVGGIEELGGDVAADVGLHLPLTSAEKILAAGASAVGASEIYEHFEGGSKLAVNAEHGTVIKRWTANGAHFEEYGDGTISVLKKNGRVKNYRPYHPKVFGKKLKINAFLSLAKKYEKDYKGLKKIFEKRARRK